MIIYYNGKVFLDTEVEDNSCAYRSLMGEDSLTLYFSLPEFVDIPINAYCKFQGREYFLESPVTFKKQGTGYYEYTATFEGPVARLIKYKIRNDVDKRLKFQYTGKPIDFLRLIVSNLNDRDPGWTIGQYIDLPEQYISFSHNTIREALQDIAKTFGTEWEIKDKVVHLRKVEYNKEDPLPLSYGKGNGFEPGVGRSNISDTMPIEILFVEGGNKNIDFSAYGSQDLLLPKSQRIKYDGAHFEDEAGFNKENAREYITDEYGFSVRRADKELITGKEDSLDCTHIHPGRIGDVTDVEEVDKDKHFWDIIDSTIPEDLDFSQYRIDGERITLIFQTGMLAGKEFEIEQSDTAVTGYVHDERRWKLVPEEIDGLVMPDRSSGYYPKKGDRYAVFGIMLPDAYICNNSTKSGASWDMLRVAVRHKYDNEDLKFSFEGKLQSKWAKKNWENIGGKILLGGYVSFTDEVFQQESILIRIIGIKNFVNTPHSPEIELSNVPVGSDLISKLREVDSNEVVNELRHEDALSFTKRRWRDLKETSEMLAKALEGFSAEINPIAISTMHIKIGSEQLQFRFVNSKTSPVEFIPSFTMNNSTKVFSVTHRYALAYLQHMTLGIDTISPSHSASEYSYWQIGSNSNAFSSGYLGDNSSPYYLYAKCSKTVSQGSYYLSLEPINMDPGDGYYYFLVGTLSSEWEGARSFEACYGFTEILPGRITTNLIKSSNGNTYFDLAVGEIGGNIRITSGSGYNNLSDKPNLSVYATKTELSVESDRITSTVTSINNLNKEYNIFKSEIEQTANRLTLSVNAGTGKMLYKDLEFSTGTNNTVLYNNSGGTGLTYERVTKSSDLPTGSSYMMKLTFIYGTSTSPGLGGFRWGHSSRANAVYEAHILAKIPIGYKICFTTNSVGTGDERTWLTSQEGTGKWETYIHRVRCGASGSFSTTNFFYLEGDKPTVQYSTNGTTWTTAYSESAVYVRILNKTTGVYGSAINLNSNPNANKLIWYVGSATVYDLSVHEDVISQINLTPGEIKIQASKISLEGTVTANEYFKINPDGSMAAQKVTVKSGTFTDVIIQGSLRCAFQSGYYSLGSSGPISVSTQGLQNNNHVVIPGSGSGWTETFSCPWTSDYNGFRAIIVNEDWGGTTSKGAQYCSAPSGKYFWENGRRLTSLSVGPKEGVEMIGFGEGSSFKGWFILNRFATTSQNYITGFPFTVMYAGTVYQSGSMRRYTGYDGDTLTSTRLETGKYRVTFRTSFSSTNNYIVFVTGEDESDGKYGRYASILKRTTSYFEVYTGDDASPNDAAFHFLVVNTAKWGT